MSESHQLDKELDLLGLWCEKSLVKLNEFFVRLKNSISLEISKQQLIRLHQVDTQVNQQIEKSNIKILNRIQKYENQCIKRLTEAKLTKYYDCYKELAFKIENEKKLKNANLTILINLVKNEMIEIKRDVFNNKTMAFYDSNKLDFNTNKSVGKLVILNGLYLEENLMQKLSKETRLLESDLTKETIVLKSIEYLIRPDRIIDELEYDQIKKIDLLDLRSEELTSVSLNSFKSFKLLNKLDLSYNKLTWIDCTTFNHLDNLIELYLNNNQFTYFDPATFYCLIRLEILDLSNNKLNRIDRDTFYSLDSLKELNLKGNQGIKITDNKYFVGLKNDCQVIQDQHWFENLVDAFSFDCISQ